MSEVEELKAKISVVDDNATRNLERITKQFEKHKKEMERLKQNMKKMSEANKKLKSSLDPLTKKHEVKVDTKKAENNVRNLIGSLGRLRGMLGSIGRGLGGGILLGAAAGGAGLSYAGYKALTGGAELEKYGVSMQHFIGVQNKGMSKDAIQKNAQAYIRQLRDYANLTPFETNDVIAGGSRALQVAMGDTKGGMGVLEVAGDMAALTPGKGIMDAIEALADAKNGEMERLKEFGFKVSAEQFKGYVGKGKNDNLTDSETAKAFDMLISQKLNPFFAGGADKLSQTAAGKWSTFTGNMQSGLSDLGFKVIDKLNKTGGMDKLIRLSDRFSKSLDKIADNVATLGSKLFDKMLKAGDKGMGGLESMFKRFNKDVESWLNGDKSFGDILNEWISDGFKKLDSVVTDNKEVIQSTISKFIKYTVNALSSNKSEITDVGVTLGSALAKGIADGFSSNPLISTLAGAAAGGLIGGPWGAVFGAVAALGYGTGKKIDEHLRKGDKKEADRVSDAADLYTHRTGALGGKNAELRAIGQKRVPRNNTPYLLHEGERVLTKQQANKQDNNIQGQVLITGNTFNVREEADIQKIAKEFVRELQLQRVNFGGAPA